VAYGGDGVAQEEVVEDVDVVEGPFGPAGHGDDSRVVGGDGVVDDPGPLGAGDVDAAAAVGVDEVVGDESAAGVDLEEDPAAVVVVGDVGEDADLGVLAVVEEGKGVTLYLDGKPVARKDTAAKLAQNDLDLWIGKKAWGGRPQDAWIPGHFAGAIDEVKIWSRPLSEDDIRGEATRR